MSKLEVLAAAAPPNELWPAAFSVSFLGQRGLISARELERRGTGCCLWPRHLSVRHRFSYKHPKAFFSQSLSAVSLKDSNNLLFLLCQLTLFIWYILSQAVAFNLLASSICSLSTEGDDLRDQETVSRVLAELLDNQEDLFDSEDDDISSTNDYSSINEQVLSMLLSTFTSMGLTVVVCVQHQNSCVPFGPPSRGALFLQMMVMNCFCELQIPF